MLDFKDIHVDWLDFLQPEILLKLGDIQKRIGTMGRYTPSDDLMLRFLKVPLKSAQVIILGQDPYPQEGAATGRAFEVGNLQSWHQPFSNVSLQNIIRAVVRAQTGEIYRFNEIRQMLNHGLQLPAPSQLFVSWEKQGVLLLNTAFSCSIHNPASHAYIWNPFTQRLLRYVNSQNPHLIWFLWGNHASAQVEGIHLSYQVRTYHPSRCQPRANDFLYGDVNCFDVKVSPIQWTYVKD